MFNFDKRPKNLFFCVGLNKPFSPNPTALLGCNWTSLEINPPIAKWTGPLGWTPLSPLAPPCQLSRWVDTPAEVDDTVELDLTPPSPKRQRHHWVGYHPQVHSLPKVNATVGLDFTPPSLPKATAMLGLLCCHNPSQALLTWLHGVLTLKCMHHLILPSWMHVLYFLNSTQNRP